MNMRKITSLIMLISFILLLATSVILYIVPQGRVAYWSDWKMLGLSKTQWGNLHINLGLLLLLAGFLHLFYNWKPMISYMKNKARELKIFTKNFNIALILSLVVSVGTLLDIPPMSTIINLSESIKDAAAQKYGEPPYGHAELTSLNLFTKKTNLDLLAAKKLLDDAGIQVLDDKVTLGDLAKINNTSPKGLFEIMQPAQIKDKDAVSFPDSPPLGFGRMTLAEICATYTLSIPTIIRSLEQKGIKADPSKSLKEIATDNNTEPFALFEILHGLVDQ